MTKKFLSIHFLIILVTASIYSQNSELKVKIVNGTTGGIGEADSLKVIVLREAMQPIKELKNVRGSFTIKDINLPDGIPVLIQANYRGANYNKMIPPIPEARKKEISIEVYETTSKNESISIKSLIQLVKLKDRLQVYKIYILQNTTNPPMSYSPSEGLDFYVPQNAIDLSGTWTQGNSKMGIPMSFEDKGANLKSINRSVLPGNTEIQIGFSIPWEEGELSLDDKILFENDTNDTSKPIFIRPKDMELKLEGGIVPVELKDDIPEGLKAYIVSYEKKSRMIEFILSGGTPIQPRFGQEPRQIVNGSWIKDWDSSLVATIGILALLFSLQFISDYFIKRRIANGK